MLLPSGGRVDGDGDREAMLPQLLGQGAACSVLLGKMEVDGK